jgi:hypothetical protein
MIQLVLLSVVCILFIIQHMLYAIESILDKAQVVQSLQEGKEKHKGVLNWNFNYLCKYSYLMNLFLN